MALEVSWLYRLKIILLLFAILKLIAPPNQPQGRSVPAGMLIVCTALHSWRTQNNTTTYSQNCFFLVFTDIKTDGATKSALEKKFTSDHYIYCTAYINPHSLIDFSILIKWTSFIFILFLIEILASKQCRPWSDAVFCGIWSGSALFA